MLKLSLDILIAKAGFDLLYTEALWLSFRANPCPNDPDNPFFVIQMDLAKQFCVGHQCLETSLLLSYKLEP